MAETLYIIDGYAQIFRAYYAIRGGMRSPVTSEPTHAVFGFTGMLIKLFEQYTPDYVMVAVDAPGKTFRDELYDQYKATRNATPEDLTAQIPRIYELLEGFGIPVIGVPGLEADDVIATITCRVLEDPGNSNLNIRIVSKDKDLEQLISDRVSLFDIHTDAILDLQKLKETKGISPEQVVDILALMGDSIDNVPGVEGVGPKTALDLVKEFGSIDGIFSNLDKIKGKKRENLEKARDVVQLSRQLVRLKCNADFDFSLDHARKPSIQCDRLLNLFQQLGFRRYQDDVRRLVLKNSGAAGSTATEPAQTNKSGELEFGFASDFPSPGKSSSAETREPGQSPPEAESTPSVPLSTAADCVYECLTTESQLLALVEALRQQQIIAVDTETTSLLRNCSLCGISMAWKDRHGAYIPILSPCADTHLNLQKVLSLLKPIFEDARIRKCGHNIKFDASVLLREGIRLRGIVFDSMLASALVDPGQSAHKLDHLAKVHLKHQMIPITELIGTGGNEQITMDTVPLDKISIYAAEDADITLRLHQHFRPILDSQGLTDLLEKVEAPLTAVLAEMENNGIKCDPEELLKQGAVLEGRVEELRKQIITICGTDFDLNSPRQLAYILFEKLGLERGKKTKTGYSTDIEVLEKLAAQEDANDLRTSVPRLIIEYRQLTKLISTYLGNLRNSVDPRSGRIHSTFHQLVTATGRLASQNPNLQNIPIRTEVGRQIRKAFIAPAGHQLICADYSQIELRLLAHLSGDTALLEAFEKDMDIHTAVAAQVFGMPPDQVTREQRGHAKTINFGIIYGVTPYGLARRISGMDVSTATKLIHDYKQKFSGIDKFLNLCVQQAIEQGYVTTILGRRRAIPEIRSTNRNIKNLGERLAINSVVQGSAADLIKIAMVNVHQRIDRDSLPMKLLLQIHDELVLETPTEFAEQNAAIIRDEMERAMTLKIPLKAETGIGPDWFLAK